MNDIYKTTADYMYAHYLAGKLTTFLKNIDSPLVQHMEGIETELNHAKNTYMDAAYSTTGRSHE